MLTAASRSSDVRCYAARREVDPAVTLARVRPLLGPMGITRIANITGLDRLGLPVVNVVRPNARSNAVSQGKGLDLDAAKASGVMEAIETHCAEHVLKPLKLASAAEMARHHRLPDLAALARPRGSRFDEGTRILWIEGRDLLGGESLWVPFELVHMNFTVPAPPGSGHFLLGSNGLASGNVPEEALAHGLGELIERDASALFDLDDGNIKRRRIDLESVVEPYCRTVIETLQAADLAVALWDMTSDIGVAAIRCQIMEPAAGPGTMPLPAGGEACHPDRNVALLRAINEAAQARLSVIAGVRDDIGPDMYGRSDDPSALEAWRRLVSRDTGTRRFEDLPDRPLESIEDEVAHLLAGLRGAGLDQALSIDLSPTESDAIAVLRVIVPGLEPMTEADCLPGRRARAAMDTQA